MTWTLTDAADLVRRVNPRLYPLGWMAGVYGSVLVAGSGRDLDLLVAGGFDARAPELAVAVIFGESAAHDYLVLAHQERGLHGYVLNHFRGPIDLTLVRP